MLLALGNQERVHKSENCTSSRAPSEVPLTNPLRSRPHFHFPLRLRLHPIKSPYPDFHTRIPTPFLAATPPLHILSPSSSFPSLPSTSPSHSPSHVISLHPILSTKFHPFPFPRPPHSPIQNTRKQIKHQDSLALGNLSVRCENDTSELRQ